MRSRLTATGAARERKHYVTIQSLALTIGAAPALVSRLDAFRKKRNIGDYERAGSTSAMEASELRDLAREPRAAAHAWLERHHAELV